MHRDLTRLHIFLRLQAENEYTSLGGNITHVNTQGPGSSRWHSCGGCHDNNLSSPAKLNEKGLDH